jgi:hypothetical protein
VDFFTYSACHGFDIKPAARQTVANIVLAKARRILIMSGA